jgi:hypothetical protein
MEKTRQRKTRPINKTLREIRKYLIQTTQDYASNIHKPDSLYAIAHVAIYSSALLDLERGNMIVVAHLLLTEARNKGQEIELLQEIHGKKMIPEVSARVRRARAEERRLLSWATALSVAFVADIPESKH